MQCYKCGTTEDLAKRTSTLYMCRPCRRKAYANRDNDKIPEPPVKVSPEWLERSKLSIAKILEIRCV